MLHATNRSKFFCHLIKFWPHVSTPYLWLESIFMEIIANKIYTVTQLPIYLQSIAEHFATCLVYYNIKGLNQGLPHEKNPNPALIHPNRCHYINNFWHI